MSATDGVYATLSKANLLVVEDEILVLLELESVLREAGADEIHLCRNVDSALNRIEQENITAAILDVRLGQEVVTPVAQALAQRGTPFIFYTGQTSRDPVLRQWPKDRILPKPARAHTIVDMLSKAIRGESALSAR
jgi:DNA-binding NtrC family response regulator